MVAAILQGINNMSTWENDHGKTPLHLGASLGMINLCMHVLSKVSPVEKYILLKDGYDSTALHISVARSHFEVTRLLLSAVNKLPAMVPDDLLHIAIGREDDAMVKRLVSRFIGLKHISSSGESCLYIAAQLGREDYIRLLLPKLGSELVDAAESACQSTPLFIGCMEMHISTVMLLITAGADRTRLDHLGWIAQENVAFRGHVRLAAILSTIDATPELRSDLTRNQPQQKNLLSFDIFPGLAHIVLNLGSLQKKCASNHCCWTFLACLVIDSC